MGAAPNGGCAEWRLRRMAAAPNGGCAEWSMGASPYGSFAPWLMVDGCRFAPPINHTPEAPYAGGAIRRRRHTPEAPYAGGAIRRRRHTPEAPSTILFIHSFQQPRRRSPLDQGH